MGVDGGAVLAIAVCTGVQMQRNVLRNRALQAADSEAVVERLAAVLDLIGQDGELPTRAPAAE